MRGQQQASATGETYVGPDLSAWAPHPVSATAMIGREPVRALAAVLEQDVRVGEGAEVPAWWHWLYFLDWPPGSELGPDGHPRYGDFLPPLPDRRRMFAGARLRLLAPLLLGELAHRTSDLVAVATKQTRSGSRTFVTVRHKIEQAGTVRLVEEQDLVYRSGGGDAPRRPEALTDFNLAPTPVREASWTAKWSADPVLLFRFSALTGNAHRIHYDTAYATAVEGYPDLVVHGPLLALVMASAAAVAATKLIPCSMSFRLRAPVFAGDEVYVCAGLSGARAHAAVLDGVGATLATYDAAPR